jgi:ABC-type hemin transport system ATPase subunit
MTKPLFDNLEIRQFRAFDYIKIDQLGHINLFLGKNNVGKSTLLNRLTRSRDALGQIEEAGLEISKLQAEPRGLLKINTPMSFGILHIAPALPAT